ncbi:MAG TPA: LuxR C-terminal-related transcriptional regulator [Methyloceanibacter sp.]|nr:LuxR C-terminal-related transcriptional regulator [Methyloceanibacter sp.]
MLSRLTEQTGALWTLMSSVPFKVGNVLSFQNVEADPDYLSLFHRKYATPETNPTVPLMLASKLGDILLREKFFDDATWERFDIYQEICRPAGIGACLGAVLLRSEKHFMPLGMFRSKNRGAYETEALTDLACLLPHLRRMAQIMLRLTDLEAKTKAAEALWDRLPYGVALLDAAGHVLWANSSAEAILLRGDGLFARNGTLEATGPEQNAALTKLIGETAETAMGRGLRSGGLALPRDSESRRPPALLTAPFRLGEGSSINLQRPPATVVFISDPERNPHTHTHTHTPAGLLAELYGFTGRESALAQLLLEGFDVREAAARLGIGMTTVRTHLRQVFEKTGTHRQAELVSVLLPSVVALKQEP